MRLTRAYWTKPRGGAGWLAMAGMAAGIVTWWPIAVAAGGGWFTLAMIGYRRSARAMAHLEAALPDTTRTGPLTPGDRVKGAIGEMPFEVRNGLDTMHVLISTPLPPGIAIDRTWDGYVLGDPKFDTAFRVRGYDSESELAWRMMLTAELRAKLVDLFAGYAVELRDGWFDIVIDDDEADGPKLERLVRDGIALGLELYAAYAKPDKERTENWIETFVEQIPREPIANVRMCHYLWLVNGGYEVPALLHLASKDPDPDIRAWANSQRPSETLYR